MWTILYLSKDLNFLPFYSQIAAKMLCSYFVTSGSLVSSFSILKAKVDPILFFLVSFKQK